MTLSAHEAKMEDARRAPRWRGWTSVERSRRPRHMFVNGFPGHGGRKILRLYPRFARRLAPRLPSGCCWLAVGLPFLLALALSRPAVDQWASRRRPRVHNARPRVGPAIRAKKAASALRLSRRASARLRPPLGSVAIPAGPSRAPCFIPIQKATIDRQVRRRTRATPGRPRRADRAAQRAHHLPAPSTSRPTRRITTRAVASSSWSAAAAGSSTTSSASTSSGTAP